MNAVSHWSRWLFISLIVNLLLFSTVQFVPIPMPGIGGDNIIAVQFIREAAAAQPTLPPPPLVASAPPPPEVAAPPPVAPQPEAVVPPPAERTSGKRVAGPTLVSVPLPASQPRTSPTVKTTTGPGGGDAVPSTPTVLTSPNGGAAVPPGTGDGGGTGGAKPTPPPPGPTRPARALPGKTPPATYPKGAMEESREGAVVVHVTVDADGQSDSVRIASSSGDNQLDAAALAAVRKWGFEGALENGAPVSGGCRIKFDFAFTQLTGGRFISGEVLP